MDGPRFDDLVKSLGASRSRRGALGAFAGAALAAVGLGQASAAAKRAVGNSCRVNSDCASNLCVQESRTRKVCHCGAASDCPAVSGQCQTAACLPTGYCGASVTTGASCDNHDACTANAVCQADGSCQGAPTNCDDGDPCTFDWCDRTRGCQYVPISCDDGNPCTIDVCHPATGECLHTPVVCPAAPNECYDPGTCQFNYGGCSPATYHGNGAPCSVGVCHDGACCTPEDKAVTCASGKCGPQPNNCGQTVQCLAPASASCQNDDECCSGVCAGNFCQGGPVATGGSCEVDSDCLTRHCCSGICRDFKTDIDNCGWCGNVCSSNHMSVVTCTSGVCDGACAPGYGDCDFDKLTNGCEADFASDPENCGGCDNLCAGPGFACTGGVCICTPEDPSVTCAGGKCGSQYNYCGDRIDCGACGSGQTCSPMTGRCVAA